MGAKTILATKVRINAKVGYTPGKHGVCENIYEHITNSVGGENILICIGLILASLVIYGLIVLFFRIVRKKDSLPQAQATEDNLYTLL